MSIPAEIRAQAADLIAYIDASPSPWHAAASSAQRLQARGYTQLHEDRRWHLEAGGRYYVVRGGASVIAFILGSEPLAEAGFRLVGAHTDSPGLRLKPRAAHESCGVLRLGVEVYGGPILASFTDRDLSLAGRVVVRVPGGFETRLLRFDAPLLRLPNLAIHMNREVNEKGLKLDKQTELPLILGIASPGIESDSSFRSMVADKLQAETGDILTWELAVYDTQKGGLWGADEEFIADSQLDNLASCHAALSALLACGTPAATCVCACFDHEEVGSESAAGAAGSFVSDLINRIAASAGMDEEARRCALARSFFISADMAHAYHPNFPAAYEPGHKVMVNAGPVIKSNANQRYTTGADSAARFISLCERAGVPFQQYAHRSDLSCGSTIGPIVAARLGIASVDVGSPLWAMHSLRESAGVLDHAHMIAVLGAAFKS
ncbi:MAG TPA: M18 family aminopeptidase [Rhodocyclaceae bacterium]|nr:M18 family aminopeptidase [Rhodocyclaceae bacterium]